jgi:NAD(P)-dependent dehydrogenase (short-subunit alcohol dehydrogenase family)
MANPVCVVTGVGPGNGASFTRRFANEGYSVAMLARTEARLRELEQAIPGSRGFPTDVTDAEAVRASFAKVRAELGPVDVLVHNAGSAVFGGFMEIPPEKFEEAWRTNALALFLCGREAVSDMQRAAGGAVIVIGATASIRGGGPFAAFASAKAAERVLAQSMARSLGPLGIHVAHLIIDGVIDMPATRGFFKDKPDDFFLQPDRIADAVYHLVRQDRSAWTFELDVRPFGEKW